VLEGIVFRSPKVTVPARTLHQVRLECDGPAGELQSVDGGVTFSQRGWYEVLLSVEWSATNIEGTRFAHTAVPDQHPLHSEAINAAVLAALSSGRQLLRGNTIFVPGEADHISLEVWHDAAEPIDLHDASLEIRNLDVLLRPMR
jgi:hypothetical protein